MEHLRIVTWNCGMALARKAPSLLALNPDIAVIQECSKNSVDVLQSHGFSGLWFGANLNKGLAVCSDRFTLQATDKLFGKWVVPVRVRGAVDFNLLAVWACPVGTRRADNYIGQVYRFLAEQSGWFDDIPVVVAGDFNSNSQWDEERPGRNHTEVVRLFGGHGLISAYHAHHGEKQGAETRHTSYLYRHQDKPFHIDYAPVARSSKASAASFGR